MTPKTILEIHNLVVEFRTHEGVVQAVNSLSYSLNEGETLGIVGESGSGKSVSAMSVMHLLPIPPAYISPKSQVRFQNQNILNLPEKKKRGLIGQKITMIFQDPMTSLNPYRRIDEQLIEAVCYHQNISKQTALKKAQGLLEYVQIPEAEKRLKQYPHEMSGGMRQRIMIAMALMSDPTLIFADEPTTALDVTVQAQIMKLFREIKTQHKAAIVLISHDLGLIATQCDHIVVMYAGMLMEYGTPDEIFENPKHPYTIALKASIPDLYPKENENSRLEAIAGNPPNLMKLGKGCPFAPRCRVATDRCHLAPIPLQEVSPQHYTRCIHS